MPKVLIDPGHSPYRDNKVGIYSEAEFVWRVSLQLEKRLTAHNIVATRTRKLWQEDYGVVLRGEMSKGYDMFLSQHTNASDDPNRRGVVVYRSLLQPQNDTLAMNFVREIANHLQFPQRGVQTWRSTNYPTRYDYHGVLYGSAQKAKCPVALIIEQGYHTNTADRARLLRPETAIDSAEAQCKVICEYFGIKYIPLKVEEESPVKKINVKLDGKTYQGYLEGGTSYIPARRVLDELKVKFTWHGEDIGLEIHKPVPDLTPPTETQELIQLRLLRAAVEEMIAAAEAADRSFIKLSDLID